MSEVIQPLPEYITDLIRALGGRKLVLLEGPDDELFFNEVFLDKLADAAFIAVSGKADVLARISDIQAQLPDISAFGVIDRDFASDAEVAASLNDPSSNCFLLRRYAIENYVLEPPALWNVLRVFLRAQLPHAAPEEMATHLLEICTRLRTVMAANFVIRQVGNDLPLFHDKHELKTRVELIGMTAKITGLGGEETELRIAAREALIDEAIATGFDKALHLINGKHLIYQILRETLAVKRGLTEGHLFSLLVDWHKENPPPHPDLVEIVEHRILQS